MGFQLIHSNIVLATILIIPILYGMEPRKYSCLNLKTSSSGILC